MAKLEAGRKSSKYIIKSLLPDVCKVPPSGVPTPFNIQIKLTNAISHSGDVNFKGDPAAMVALRCSPVTGNEAGTLGGVISGVNMGACRPINFVPTVRVNKKNALYHNDNFCFMNCAGPEGPYNTFGKLYCLDGMDTGPAADPGDPMAGDPAIALTPNEANFLGGGSGLISKLANIPGMGVDLAKMAYGISQNGFSTEAVLGGLGGIAGIAGMDGLAQAAQLGLQAKALAETDWDNPAAALASLGGMAGLGGAMSTSPQLAQVAKGLGTISTGFGIAQSITPSPGSLMLGINSINTTRVIANQSPEQGKKLQTIAQQSASYKSMAQQAKSAQATQSIAATSLPAQFETRLNKVPGAF